MIRIYPNRLSLDTDGLCDEFTTDSRMTLATWLKQDGGLPPFGSIGLTVNDEVVPEHLWPMREFLPRDDVVMWVQPKGADPFSITVALIAGVKAAFNALMPKLPGTPKSPGSGDQLAQGSAKGNKVKLGDVIRESFGLQKIYPDYLLPPHKYFSSYREQQTEVLLCVGKGQYQINANNVRIGDTALIALGSEASYQLYGPDEYLGGNTASVWWHSAPEVGSSSTGAAGLELTVTSSFTPNAIASSFTFSGYTINIPSGAGSFPTDWNVGLVLRVIAPYQYTVTDGGAGQRDVITGPLGMLNPTVGDTIEVVGANAGFYVVNSYTPGSSPSMTLNYTDGSPATALAAGTSFVTIGPSGLLFRISAKGTNSITVDRLDEAGGVDSSFPGFDSLNSAAATVSVDTAGLEGGWRGPFPVCPENEVTQVVQWDVFFPEGLCYVNQQGNVGTLFAYYTVQYRDMALGSGAPYTTIDYQHSNNTLDQGGFTITLNLPYPMRAEFRMRKRTPFGTSLEWHDTIQWYGLRSLLAAPSSYPGVTVLAARVQSSDRIAAQTESLIYVIGTRLLPVRNGDSWTAPVPTRDIEPAFAYVAKSQGYTDAEIDLIEADRLDGVWRARGDHFDHAQTEETTGKEMLNLILGTGFAEFTLDRGVIRPVRDEPRSTFEHMYTPQNMTEMLSRDVQMMGPDDFDGVEVTYQSRITWADETIVCLLPGDVGRRLEKITADGVIDRTKAYQQGMRRRRIQRYRRDTYTWSTEMDALNSRYLSYCAVADDVPGYGQSALLVNWVEGNGMVLLESSEPLDWSAEGAHMVALRRPDGTVSGPYVATQVDEYRLTVPTLDFEPDISWEEEPPHILFGPAVRWTYPVLITSISPNGTDDASVEAVGYDARVYLSDDAVAP